MTECSRFGEDSLKVLASLEEPKEFSESVAGYRWFSFWATNADLTLGPRGRLRCPTAYSFSLTKIKAPPSSTRSQARLAFRHRLQMGRGSSHYMQ